VSGEHEERSDETRGDPFVVTVDDFTGPLDLLLHLVRRHEVEIERLPLERITQEYLETLEFLQAIELEPAGEFLEVAATLIRMKARALLPRPESAEDPEAAAAEEAELLRQLVEHQVVRMAATRLRRREAEAAAVWFRGEPDPAGIEETEKEVVECDLFSLVAAFRGVLQGLDEPDIFEIAREEYPVAARAEEIRRRLRRGKPIPFIELFEPGAPRGKLIATFLALLELIRWAEAKAFQEGAFGPILIFPTDQIGAGAESGAPAESSFDQEP
jgi:segregation and condensation protein A